MRLCIPLDSQADLSVRVHFNLMGFSIAVVINRDLRTSLKLVCFMNIKSFKQLKCAQINDNRNLNMHVNLQPSIK